MNNINGIIGKVTITADLILESGLHIGGGESFSAIGAIDNPIVRDTLTREPYIPGSSLKGKMRYLLSRKYAVNSQLPDIKNEDIEIKRLFGSSGNDIVLSRLQFSDIFLTKDNVNKLKKVTDGDLTETKYENTIHRLTAVANPRQMERVPRGGEFNFKVTYVIETLEEFEKDIENIKLCINLLQNDYLGGGGTRGSGRVQFENFDISDILILDENVKENVEKTLNKHFRKEK